MINEFEETNPLTSVEVSMIPLFVKGLSNKIGEGRAITNAEMVTALKSHGLEIYPARVRKIINHIRTQKLVKNLIATSKGYYIEVDQNKIKNYVESLRQRASAILEVANSY